MQNTDISELIDESAACRVLGGEHTPIHRSSLWRGIGAGRYPKPLKVGPSTNRWSKAELLEVLDRAAAARNGEAA
jgi:predicted DNA-binding transcriptional regulator AlpA